MVNEIIAEAQAQNLCDSANLVIDSEACKSFDGIKHPAALIDAVFVFKVRDDKIKTQNKSHAIAYVQRFYVRHDFKFSAEIKIKNERADDQNNLEQADIIVGFDTLFAQ